MVDPSERHMTLKTTNVTFGSFLSMDEVLQYRPHPTDPSKTLLRQQATVSIEGVPLNRYMEDVLTKNISFNASRGRQGLEWVINKINTEVKPAKLQAYQEVVVLSVVFVSILGERNCIIGRRFTSANQKIIRRHYKIHGRPLHIVEEDPLLVRSLRKVQ